MNKILFLSVYFIAATSYGKTVQDVIKLIEKKQGKIPSYQSAIKRKSRVNVRVQKPSSNFSVVFPEGTAERNYEEKLNKEIDQLYYLSKKLKGSSTKQRIWMRLAKAYSEKAALIERREHDNYDRRLKLYLSGAISRKPGLDFSKSKSYNQKAIGIYKNYYKNYPKAKDLDQVLFFLGYNNMGLGNTKSAVKYFETLSRRYPKSEFVNEANLSLGDYHFEKDQRTSAKSYYSKVVNGTRSPIRSLALYKLAWAKHKSGEHQSGLKDLLKVISISKQAGDRNRRDVALGAEAKKDLPMFYAEAGDPRAAITYFTNVMNRKEASAALEKLAYYYADKGDKQEAQYLFGKLMEMNPNSDKSFDYQASLVDMQAATGRGDLYEKELYRWIQKFGPQSSWARQAKDKRKVRESLGKAEFELRSHVLKLHNRSRQTKSKADMAKAESGYALYLKSFAGYKNFEEMQFYNAELLYEMGLYRKAYVLYKRVKSPKYKSKAELNSVLTLERVIPTDIAIRKRVGKSTKKYPLSPSEKEFIAAGEKYLSSPGNTEQRQDIEYRIANIYYSHNYFDESEVKFKKIIKKYPKSKYAGYASNLIIDSYKLRKDYEGLEKAGADLVALGSNSVKIGEVKSIVEQSAFKKIENSVSDAKPAETAASFMAFLKKYPNSGYANLAYYNSGIYYEKAGDLNKALAAYGMVSDGEKDLYPKSQKFAAYIYEKTGQLNKASRFYEDLGSGKVSVAEKRKFLSNAATIREAFNDTTGMKRVFSKLNQYDSVKNINLYNYRLAKAYERIGNTSQSLKYRINFFNAAKADPFLLIKTARSIGDTYKAQRNTSKSEYWYRATLLTYQKYKNSGAQKSSADAAKAKFELTNKTFYDYVKIKVPANPAKQNAAIEKKLKLIDKINKQMKEVIDYDDGYTIVAALNRQGQAYQHLTFAILNVPLPKELTAEERKQVKVLVENKVKPFKVNAISAYEKALEKAKEFNAYGPDHLSALREMAKIEPSYSKYKVPYSSAIGIMNFSADTDKKYDNFSQNFGLFEGEVLKKYGEILSKDPKNDEALFGLAQYYSTKKLSKVSQIFLEKTSSNLRNSAEGKNLQGVNSLLENERRLAIKYFNEAAKAVGDGTSANVNLSTLYSKFGGYAESGNLLSKIDPVQRGTFPKKLKQLVINNFAIYLLTSGKTDEGMSELKSLYADDNQYLPALANLSIAEKVLQKNKSSQNQYLGQYKKLAKDRGDFDRIRLLEKIKL